MTAKLYVGNLSYSIDDEMLTNIFLEIGDVVSARIIMDRDTGRPKGFGFVEMASDQEAQAAINRLNGKVVEGRPLLVNEARPQEPRNNNRTGGGGGYAPRRTPYGSR